MDLIFGNSTKCQSTRAKKNIQFNNFLQLKKNTKQPCRLVFLLDWPRRWPQRCHFTTLARRHLLRRVRVPYRNPSGNKMPKKIVRDLRGHRYANSERCCSRVQKCTNRIHAKIPNPNKIRLQYSQNPTLFFLFLVANGTLGWVCACALGKI